MKTPVFYLTNAKSGHVMAVGHRWVKNRFWAEEARLEAAERKAKLVALEKAAEEERKQGFDQNCFLYLDLYSFLFWVSQDLKMGGKLLDFHAFWV